MQVRLVKSNKNQITNNEKQIKAALVVWNCPLRLCDTGVWCAIEKGADPAKIASFPMIVIDDEMNVIRMYVPKISSLSLRCEQLISLLW